MNKYRLAVSRGNTSTHITVPAESVADAFEKAASAGWDLITEVDTAEPTPFPRDLAFGVFVGCLAAHLTIGILCVVALLAVGAI